MLDIYERIDALSKERRVSNKALAEYLGFSSPQTFTNWKYNDSMPKADVAVKIAKFFGVSVEYLVTGETSNPLESQLEEMSNKYFMVQRKYDLLKTSMLNLIKQS